MAFPPVFDPRFYRAHNPDLLHMSDAEALSHYCEFGMREGRAGNAPARREAFVKLVPSDGLALEIAPWFKPVLSGSHVRYFDIHTTEEAQRMARDVGGDPSACPQVHYVSPTGDLSVVPDRFRTVLSSHVIEHQPDLVRHLRVVADLLDEDGCYFVIAPDKRYCFDHFMAVSTIADVLDAHLRKRTFHDPRNILEYRLLRTHNEPMRHWQGDHGKRLIDENPAELRPSIDEASRYDAGYIDTHAWRFTPEAFAELTGTLFALGLTSLSPVRVYNAVIGSSEFTAILQKVGRSS